MFQIAILCQVSIEVGAYKVPFVFFHSLAYIFVARGEVGRNYHSADKPH